MSELKLSEYPAGTVIRTNDLTVRTLAKGQQSYPDGWYALSYMSLEEADQLQAEGRAEIVSVPWAVTKALIESIQDYAEFRGGSTNHNDILRRAVKEAKNEKS